MWGLIYLLVSLSFLMLFDKKKNGFRCDPFTLSNTLRNILDLVKSKETNNRLQYTLFSVNWTTKENSNREEQHIH